MEVCHASYQIIADLLFERTGQQLTENRRWRIGSALASVFREHGISNVDQLVCLLDEPGASCRSSDIATDVVEALLNNETYFFRDKPTFDQIPERILPDLARKRAATRRLSIWCAGCSTGQEVYSLSMLFEDDRERWRGWTIEILGTDVSGQAIRAARSGLYSQFEVQRGLGVVQMLQHFDESASGWKIDPGLQRHARFQQHDLLGRPIVAPRSCDLILCRNVLLYFDSQTRQLAFDRLADAMVPSGYLMLGAGETVIGNTRRFRPIPDRTSLYRVQETSAHETVSVMATT